MYVVRFLTLCLSACLTSSSVFGFWHFTFVAAYKSATLILVFNVCTLALHFCVDCLLACHCQFVFPELSYLHFRYCHIFISIAQLTIFILWLCRFVDCFRLTFVVITFSTSNFTLAFYCEFYNDLRSI